MKTPPPMFPLVFLGHGNPMNAVQNNAFSRCLNALARELPRPKAILCISAHWQTRGSMLTNMAKPKTIHDFYGFPKELFEVQYPAPGSPELAQRIQKLIPNTGLDETQWGLDHGTWAVLKHMYPNADIPVVQLSLDKNASFRTHFEIGQKLVPLRNEEVLILGSGNLIHNLGQIDFEEDARPLTWATEFDEWTKSQLIAQDYEALSSEKNLSTLGRLSHPTLEHWIPLLYVLGASSKNETLRFVFEKIEHASISMRSFVLSPKA